MTRPLSFAGALLALFLLLPGHHACEAQNHGAPHEAPAHELPAGRTIAVPAGADLQRALDAARPGDTLSLAAGAVFRGPFTLPVKPGSAWIIVRGTAFDQLPSADTRVSPNDARLMPKLEASTGPVVATAPGAHHYRFVGIEIRPQRGVFLETLVRLGQGRDKKKETLPAFIAIDRCYIHGDPALGARRGVALNSRSSEVTNSYLTDFKEVGADSQAIAGWGGPGPFRIINNQLEAAGENVLFGGADPGIAGLVPADIEVVRNHLLKPVGWKAALPGGEHWSVKNLFELKNARRVHVEGNVFENNWVQAQSGYAILFTVRNQEGSAPWSVVEDVTFIDNVVKHSAAGIYVLGHDDNGPSGSAKRIRIANNLFDDIGGAAWGGGGTLLQLIGGPSDVVFEHNTAFHTHNVIMAEGPVQPRFVFSNNVVFQNQYGIIGTGVAPGLPTIAHFFPDAVVSGNVFVGGSSASYPEHNFFPASVAELGFADAAHTSVRLGAHSPYHRAATDGTDVGVDPDKLPSGRASAPAVLPPRLQPRADAR